MEHIGDQVYLTDTEAELSGLESPIPDGQLGPAVEAAKLALQNSVAELYALAGADDDDLTHVQRAQKHELHVKAGILDNLVRGLETEDVVTGFRKLLSEE